jgi:hypothetical protein
MAPAMSIPASATPRRVSGSAIRPVPTPISRHGWRLDSSAASSVVSASMLPAGSARVAS